MQSCSYPFSREWYKYSVIKLYEIVNVFTEKCLIKMFGRAVGGLAGCLALAGTRRMALAAQADPAAAK
jgi:hypothetical protein